MQQNIDTEENENMTSEPITPDEKEALESVKYRKSNRLINARGRSSATVHKLFTIAISEAHLDKTGKKAVAVIPGTKLRKILNSYSGSLYPSIKEACSSSNSGSPDLLSWRLGIEDAEKGTFHYINVVESAKFEHGQLTVLFTQSCSREIIGLKANYTEFYRYLTLQMKSSYSMVLYERLSSQADYERATTKNKETAEGPYTYTYSIEDLRAILSLDYQIDKITTRHLYMKYGDFKANVLEVAKEEINTITPITIDYTPVRAGRGGKTVAIKFTVTRKDAAKNQVVISEEEMTRRKLVFADVVVLFAGESLGVNDVKSICIEADYDIDKIKTAYELSKKSGDRINNLTGWLIKAIRGGYTTIPEDSKTTSSKKKKASKKKNSFNEFEQNQYDFEELEKQLLGNK